MVIQIYVPPEPEMELRELKMGDINDAISLEYELFFCGVGTFTLELPLTTPFAEQLLENNLLYLREDDVCFIIKNVKRTNDKITVVGYDLNGMLLDRLTMERDSGVEGTEGKDCISGTTEACVKHFVNYNMVNSADTARNYTRFAIAEDLGRGNAEDSDLVGKEILEDVVRTLCEGAELGYRVKLQLHDSETEPLLIFDVYEREDHTADQSERNRVIFSEGLQNITEIERETGITANKNALWCDTGGENVFVYTTLKNGDVFNPVGWDRREEYISLSVTDNYNTAEIEQTARKQMADKFAKTDSLVIDAGNPLDYGTVYKLGDIVTVYDKKRSLQLNSVISSVLVKRSGTEHSVQISLGERKPKLLDKYAKQSQIQRKEQTDFPPTESGGTVIENAVILLAKDISHLIHQYTVYHYIDGQKVVYTGTDSNIVIGGVIAQSVDSYKRQGTYQSIRWAHVYNKTHIGDAPASISISFKLVDVTRQVSSTSEQGWVQIYRFDTYINGESIGTSGRLVVSGNGGITYGLDIKWSSIYPPGYDERFPNGYITVVVEASAFTTKDKEDVRVTKGLGTYLVGFLSKGEFDAAIGLTIEDQIGTEVEDNVIVVPDTDASAAEILEIAYAYTDKALAAHETYADGVHQSIRSDISELNITVNSNTTAITHNSAQISDIKDPENGILADANKYTDATADLLREEFGSGTT